MTSIYHQQEKTNKLPEETKELTKQWFRKFAKSYPPYHFVVQYAKTMKTTVYDTTPEGIFGKVFGTILSNESDKDINNELRLVEIEKDLISLIEQTNNDIFYRPLFFHSIFINNDFHFEGLVVKGIYITECYAESGSNCFALHHPKPNDYAIYVVSADVEIGCEFYSIFALVNKVIGDNYNFTDTKEETARLKRLASHIRLMICNIVDMVEGNQEDLEVVKIETTREQNIKRIKKGQIAFPTKIFIKAKGEFKRYAGEYNKGLKNKLSHSFQVMGHWRHFWSEKFVNVHGEKIWILPYIKGKGILLRKDIKIIKS